jgi:uncharacterized integral membrane protein
MPVDGGRFPGGGRLAKRYPQRTVILAGFAVTIAGIVVLLALVTISTSVWAFLPGLFVVGIGVGDMVTPSVNIVQSAFGDDLQGEISGLSRSVSNLGSSLGTAIAGTILVAGITATPQRAYALAMIVMAVAGAIGLIAAAVPAPDRRHRDAFPAHGGLGHPGPSSIGSPRARVPRRRWYRPDAGGLVCRSRSTTRRAVPVELGPMAGAAQPSGNRSGGRSASVMMSLSSGMHTSPTGFGGVMTERADVEREGRRVSGGAIASLSGLAVLLIFIVQNRAEIKFRFLFLHFSWPIWLYTIVTALFGALVWFGLGVIRRHRRRVERRRNR